MLYTATVAEKSNHSEQFAFQVDAANPLLAEQVAIMSAFLASGDKKTEYICWHLIRSDWADLD